MNNDSKCNLVNEIQKEIDKLNLPYKYPFEKGKKHGFYYYGFFISIPDKAWIMFCWSDESLKNCNKSFWLELSSRAAKKWRKVGITEYSCNDKEYEVCVPIDLNRLVIPLEVTNDNMKNAIDLIISVSKDVLDDYL